MANDDGISTSSAPPVATATQMLNAPDLVHHNHPLYIHPSDTQGSVLISIQLQGSENYSIWSRSMKIVLHGKNKLGFVLGTCKREMYDPSLHELWNRCNAIILTWIMNTVSHSLISIVIYAFDAHKVWEDLKERFDKLRELWDEYETLAPPSSCGCPESDQILMTRPLPNINQAYAMIVNVESQRKNDICRINASVGIDGNDATALLSSRENNNGNNTGGGNTSYKTRNNYNYGRFALQCDYCKLKGHTRDNCYKLHGYPPDFKYRKKRGTPNTYANNVCSVGNQGTKTQGSPQQATPISNTAPPAPIQFFTSEQYNQIL
ncbi:uncharacterized protein [Nicotiana tomentosiformis]|uniref:uncharacterized protein n=1 Tax=Nicotiana tomentosiformis TaxID=4098 RepID=UPI00388C768A